MIVDLDLDLDSLHVSMSSLIVFSNASHLTSEPTAGGVGIKYHLIFTILCWFVFRPGSVSSGAVGTVIYTITPSLCQHGADKETRRGK